MEISVEKAAVHLRANKIKKKDLEKDTNVDVIKIAEKDEGFSQRACVRHEKMTDMLNSATTSSVETKVSISGCIWRSMSSLRRGKMVIGPGLK